MSKMEEIKMMNELTPNEYVFLKLVELIGVRDWQYVYEKIGMSKNTYYNCRNKLESKGLI